MKKSDDKLEKTPDDALLTAVQRMAREAGVLIMGYYAGATESRIKADASPVTDADLAANEYIVSRLAALTPDIPVISEEGNHYLPEGADKFWLVDPLDGTKSFIRRKGDFTVNIALIESGIPVLGAIDAPTRDVCYFGAAGIGAFRIDGENARSIHTRMAPDDGFTVIVSQTHRTPETDAYLNTIPVKESFSASSSLKFCLVAEGMADIYPRFGPTMEWDTAAGHAILTAAGGNVTMHDGTTFVYRKPGFRNPGFIARGEIKQRY